MNTQNDENDDVKHDYVVLKIGDKLYKVDNFKLVVKDKETGKETYVMDLPIGTLPKW